MPRKPRTKPVAAHLAATASDSPDEIVRDLQLLHDERAAQPLPHQVVQEVADAMRLPDAPPATSPAVNQMLREAGFHVPGDAAEPAHGNTDFTPEPTGPKPAFTWARVEGTAEKPVGIKVETEQERRPGIAHTRTLIRFRDDALPTADEKQKLKSEGFKYCPNVAAWGCQKSAASKILALRLVSDLAKGRGYEGSALYV